MAADRRPGHTAGPGRPSRPTAGPTSPISNGSASTRSRPPGRHRGRWLPDGTFRPTQALNRGQAAKMVVDGFGHTHEDAAGTPPSPTFSLPQFYKWVEGGWMPKSSPATRTTPTGRIRPWQRQQANTILARHLSGLEKAALGGIQGEEELYPTVTEWYQEEGPAYWPPSPTGERWRPTIAPGPPISSIMKWWGQPQRGPVLPEAAHQPDAGAGRRPHPARGRHQLRHSASHGHGPQPLQRSDYRRQHGRHHRDQLRGG